MDVAPSSVHNELLAPSWCVRNPRTRTPVQQQT